MTGSTAPEYDTAFQEPASGHPVHRATILLEQVLPNPACNLPAIKALETPVVRQVAPTAFFELGQALEDARAQCQPPVIDRVDVSVLDASAAHDGDSGDMRDYAAPAQIQGLVAAFHHSQRQASWVVAGSIGAALALTLCGLLIVLGTTSSNASGPDRAPAQEDVSSLSPDGYLAMKTASALEPIRVNAVSDAASEVKLVNARPGRPLALGPHLPLGVARYVLLRGLPEAAKLSSGRRTSAGTWMVKGEDIAGLALTLDDNAGGEHAIEIYLLDSGHGPQARRQLILRVDESPQIYAAGLGLRWPNFFPETSEQPSPAEAPATAQEQSEVVPLAEPTSQTLARGDIDTTRNRLTELAERGHADAAYQLALTYDREVLDEAGLASIEGDMGAAQAWYQQAAKAGHMEAARRLAMIAKRRSGA